MKNCSGQHSTNKVRKAVHPFGWFCGQECLNGIFPSLVDMVKVRCSKADSRNNLVAVINWTWPIRQCIGRKIWWTSAFVSFSSSILREDLEKLCSPKVCFFFFFPSVSVSYVSSHACSLSLWIFIHMQTE